MNNDILAKLVVLTIALIAAIIGSGLDRHAACKVNCITDISGQRR
jgi:hypothetical protein